MRTLVLNLARSRDRRDAISSRLSELKMSFEFVEAVDGQSLSEAQRSAYSSRAAFATIGREMHPNEIGCILSHIGIWRTVATGQDREVMVIEDDMLISPDLPALVSSLDWIPEDAAVVNLAWDMATPIDLTALTPGRSICRFDREVMRTGSYILRPRGALELLRNAFPIRMPVDSLMGDRRNVGPIYGITPRPVQWDEGLPTATWTDSTMGDFSQATRRSLKGKILRLINRIAGQ